MTGRTAGLLLVAAAAAAAAVVATEGGRMRLRAGVQAAADVTGAHPGSYGAEHLHLCQPEDFAVAGTPMLHARHPLFRRPAHIGVFRHRVAATGWAWFADPPSEQGL